MHIMQSDSIVVAHVDWCAGYSYSAYLNDRFLFTFAEIAREPHSTVQRDPKNLITHPTIVSVNSSAGSVPAERSSAVFEPVTSKLLKAYQVAEAICLANLSALIGRAHWTCSLDVLIGRAY